VLRYSFDKHEHYDNEAKRYKQKAFAFHREVLSLEDNRCLLLIFFTSRLQQSFQSGAEQVTRAILNTKLLMLSISARFCCLL
jgi:hypothetical protein